MSINICKEMRLRKKIFKGVPSKEFLFQNHSTIGASRGWARCRPRPVESQVGAPGKDAHGDPLDPVG